MAYDSILVHLDGNRQAMQRLQIAARLATASQCPLIGLLAGRVPDPGWFYLMNNAQRCLAEDQERRRLRRENMRCAFAAATQDLPLACDWRTVDRDPVTLALREAREAGLIVSGQYDADNAEGPVARQLLEALLLESGRPTLVVPCAGVFPSVGARVLVAWNGSRESARAVHDALPLVAGARACMLSAGNGAREPRADATPVSHAVRLLERRGVSVEVAHGPGGSDLAVGELILSRASDFGADLVVMGAYGHGRLRELVLGGVTRLVLESMTVPVLFSH
ncbi:universal stress protein [Cupriavidus sp. TMH.W2]|uniref:universal stress protein n=1 Tax=Cupriavidus sp. TMH.W2 TaxID=3434465 RepID=UPI003D774877